MAADAETHATDLEALTKTPSLSWESHARKLDFLKKDINVMGETLVALENRREALNTAERKELDQAAPLLKEMASDTSTAIRLLGDLREDTWRPSYQKPVEDLASVSGRLSKSLKTFVEIATLREKETHLEQNLGAGEF